jgi:diguanylate cyclase (GGDEF)-like protein/PAS domain S-box-containing protein
MSEEYLKDSPIEAIDADVAAHRNYAETFWYDVLDQSGAITLLVDGSGVIAYENAQLSLVTGAARNASIGVPVFELLGVPNDTRLQAAFRLMASGQLARLSFDCELRGADGRERSFMAVATYSTGDSPAAPIVVTAHDITERKARETRLRHNANHDVLTGAANRRAALRTLNGWLSSDRASQSIPAILLLDIDRFKSINDTYGHAAGDAVLVEVAERLQHIDRDNLGVARIGSDELMLYARFTNVHTDLPRIATQALEALRRPILGDGYWIHVVACVGIAVSTPETRSAEELLRHAGIALHQAKDAGRGVIRWFSAEEAARQRERTLLRSDLSHAMPNGEFRVFYQPIVDVTSGRAHSHETLLRWQHPTRGLLDAGAFIQEIESAGLTDAVTQWVLHAAFAQTRATPALGGVPLAINISARSLQRADFAERLLIALAAGAIEPHQIELEITEDDFVRTVDEAPANIARLHEAKIRIVIDDFGKGFSNFGYLTRFPAYAIKIDRDYVMQIGRSEPVETLVGALIGLSEELGIHAIGEGVETQEQSDFLLHHGCVLQQGFLLGRPMALDEFLR